MDQEVRSLLSTTKVDTIEQKVPEQSEYQEASIGFVHELNGSEVRLEAP